MILTPVTDLRTAVEDALDMEIVGRWDCVANIGTEGIRAVIAFDRITATDAEIHVFGRGNWLTRALLHAAAALAFLHYNLRRITAHMRAKNTRLHAIAERLGFVKEGVNRDFYPDDDAVCYRLLREDCRYGLVT